MQKKYLLIVFTMFSIIGSYAQSIEDSTLSKLHQVDIIAEDPDSLHRLMINGQVVSAMINGTDTIVVAEIANVNISSPRSFENRDDYLRYLKYKRYAAKVYPYAKEAIRIFKEAEHVSSTMKKRKGKKYMKKLAKELEQEFEEPLKGLSKTQGKILVKMIERELETPMFDLIKMTRGKLKAFYWNQSSKLYGYRLKDGYEKGQNPILDVVLQDFDISHEVDKN